MEDALNYGDRPVFYPFNKNFKHQLKRFFDRFERHLITLLEESTIFITKYNISSFTFVSRISHKKALANKSVQNVFTLCKNTKSSSNELNG